MNYIEITINTPGEQEGEIVLAMLGDFPFDSFQQDGGQLKAYIPENEYDACSSDIAAYLKGEGLAFEIAEIGHQNWNELWESNFEPIVVEQRCLIRAPFHSPGTAFEQEVVIMPKMSFGTGHHATTYLMVSEIMESDPAGLSGLDMGSGTGVLAILAAKRGAVRMDAVDIDPWAKENAEENIAANGVENIVTPLLGDASLLQGRSYDFILANINRNTLLEDMEAYNTSLRQGGFIVFSGILEEDIPAIRTKAESLGLVFIRQNIRNGWACVRFSKHNVPAH